MIIENSFLMTASYVKDIVSSPVLPWGVLQSVVLETTIQMIFILLCFRDFVQRNYKIRNLFTIS